jgi:hypothetical protein
MRSAYLLLLAVVSVTTLACGGGQEGGSCDKSGFLCADKTAALECKLGKWVKLPCRGAAGCERANEIIKCDMTANLAGDLCSSTAEGKGLCTAGGNATLECREGVLVQTNTCSSCTVSGDLVTCQP